VKKEVVVKADGTTTCCNAYSTYDGDGVEYCKGCYEEVTGYLGALEDHMPTVIHLEDVNTAEGEAEW
jgi:hypothetical protein